MTAILALRKKIDGKVHVVYGADSLIVKAQERVILKNSHKFLEFPHFAVLFSGVASVQHVLEEFKRKKSLNNRTFMKMKNKNHAYDFMSEVTKILKNRTDDLGAGDGGDEFQLLIATKNMLYSIDKWAFIIEHEEYIAGGSGEPYIMAVLNNQYSKVETAEQLKQLGIDAIQGAVDLNITCGPPIIMREFNES